MPLRPIWPCLLFPIIPKYISVRQGSVLFCSTVAKWLFDFSVILFFLFRRKTSLLINNTTVQFLLQTIFFKGHLKYYNCSIRRILINCTSLFNKMKFYFNEAFISIESWFVDIKNELSINPRGIINLIIGLFCAYILARFFWESFSFVTVIGYLFACLKGVKKIIYEPRIILVWGVGFFICAMALKLFLQTYPILDFRNFLSVFAFLFILYSILILYLRRKKLKRL